MDAVYRELAMDQSLCVQVLRCLARAMAVRGVPKEEIRRRMQDLSSEIARKQE